MNKSYLIQDTYLNQVRKLHMQVTIHLTNGYQLKGQVKGFDNYVVVFVCDGKQMMIYKHAISSVTPMEAVNYVVEEE